MSGFFAMGGYAKWVWSAFACGVVVLTYNVVSARRGFRRAVADVQAWAEEQGGEEPT